MNNLKVFTERTLKKLFQLKMICLVWLNS